MTFVLTCFNTINIILIIAIPAALTAIWELNLFCLSLNQIKCPMYFIHDFFHLT